jgi:hypothetical protein
VEVRAHFLDKVGVNIEETFDFEPLGAVFPELGGARLVGGVVVDWEVLTRRHFLGALGYILLSSKIPTCVSHAPTNRFQLYANALKMSFSIKSIHSVASVSSLSMSSLGR